jgi:hypothetical protein
MTSTRLTIGAILCCVAAPLHAQEQAVNRADSRISVAPEFPANPAQLADDGDASRRRATIIGATTGVVLGGLGTAAFILNALAPDCVTAVTATSSHCGRRSGTVALETVTIAVGATAGGFAGAWVGRRIAHWRAHDDRLR